MKMISVTWFLSVLALLVADVRTGALQQKELVLGQCYECVVTNSSDCEAREHWVAVTCPAERPHCATTAKSPDYISSLTCAVGSQAPCTFIQTAKNIHEMTCTCASHLCNAPFSRQLRNELLNVSSSNLSDNRIARLMELFINSTVIDNITVPNSYEAITISMSREATIITAVPQTTKQLNTPVPKNFEDINVPRAEALKHEATVPPDDDEDESEGSGSFEDVKSQIPAAPAAPSSFLPSNENKAIPVHINLLVAIPFISLYTMA